MENETSTRYRGVQIVSKIASKESNGEPIPSAWDKDKGLLIPSSYASGRDVCHIMVRIPRDICKEMVKDLMDEIRKEESGHVYD